MMSAAALEAFARLAADHLWQSTLVAAVAATLCLLLRRHAARVRHAIYLAASIKFLVPFAGLTAIGSAVPWPVPMFSDTPVVVTSAWSFGQPFARSSPERSSAAVPAAAAAEVRASLLVPIGRDRLARGKRCRRRPARGRGAPGTIDPSIVASARSGS